MKQKTALSAFAGATDEHGDPLRVKTAGNGIGRNRPNIKLLQDDGHWTRSSAGAIRTKQPSKPASSGFEIPSQFFQQRQKMNARKSSAHSNRSYNQALPQQSSNIIKNKRILDSRNQGNYMSNQNHMASSNNNYDSVPSQSYRNGADGFSRVQTASTNTRLANHISKAILVSKHQRKPWRNDDHHPAIIQEHFIKELEASNHKRSVAGIQRRDLLPFDLEYLPATREVMNETAMSPKTPGSPLPRRMNDVLHANVNRYCSMEESTFDALPADKWQHPQIDLNKRINTKYGAQAQTQSLNMMQLKLGETQNQNTLNQDIAQMQNDTARSASKKFREDLTQDVPINSFEENDDYTQQNAQEAIDRINNGKKTFDPNQTPPFLKAFRDEQQRIADKKKGLRPEFKGKQLEANRMMQAILADKQKELKKIMIKEERLQNLFENKDEMYDKQLYESDDSNQTSSKLVNKMKGFSFKSIKLPEKQGSTFSVFSAQQNLEQPSVGSSINVLDMSKEQSILSVNGVNEIYKPLHQRLAQRRQEDSSNKKPTIEHKKLHRNMGQKRNIRMDENAAQLLQKIIQEKTDQQDEYNIETSSMQDEDIVFVKVENKPPNDLFSPDPLKRTHTMTKNFIKEVVDKEKKGMDEQFSNALASGDFSSFNQLSKYAGDPVSQLHERQTAGVIFQQASNKINFYNKARDQNPNTANAEGEQESDQNFQFYKKCNEAQITPNPVLSKIQNNMLTLISYRMSAQIAKILGEDLLKSKSIENQIIQIVLADNDLRCNDEERSAEYIWQGLLARAQSRDKQSINHLAYSENELGERSFTYLKELIEKRNQLQTFILSNVKTTPAIIIKIMQALNDQRYVSWLRISGQPLSEPGEADKGESSNSLDFQMHYELNEFLSITTNLRHLNLSNSCLSPKMLLMIPKTLIENEACGLNRLDLSGNFRLSHAKKIVTRQKGVTETHPSNCEEFVLKLAEYLNHDSFDTKRDPNNKQLVQLNISNMNLQDQVLNLASTLVKNKSLRSFTIDDNEISDYDLSDFCSRIGVNRNQPLLADKNRIKVRSEMQILKDLAKTNIENMNAKQKVINNQLLKDINEDKKRCRVKEFQGPRHPMTSEKPLQFQKTLSFQENFMSYCNASDINTAEFDEPQSSWKFQPDGKCRIRNHDNYTLFFYKRSKAQQKLEQIVDKKKVQLLEQMLFEDDHSFVENKFMSSNARLQHENDGFEPLICGSLTGFETVRMMPVFANFCRENQPPYKFKQIQETLLRLAQEHIKSGDIAGLVEHISKGTGTEQLIAYLNEVKTANWRKIVREAFGEYHGTDFCLFNYPSSTGVYNPAIDEDVYVYACYAPAGRHQIIVKDPVNDAIYVQHLIVHMKEYEQKAIPLDETSHKMAYLQMNSRPSQQMHRIFRSTEFFKVDKHRRNIFPKIDKHSNVMGQNLGHDLKHKILLWCSRQEVQSAANNDLGRRPGTTAGEEGAAFTETQMQKEMKEISLNLDHQLFKIIKTIWPKIKKIFKLRLRTCTFPVLNKSDMIRVMRDIGLINTAKGCQEFAKNTWDSCIVYKDPEAANTPPVENAEHQFRPTQIHKVDHITTLLNVLMAFARHTYLNSEKAKTTTIAMKMVLKQNIDPYYDQFQWLKIRKPQYWRAQVAALVHYNMKWLRAIYFKFIQVGEINPKIALLTVDNAERLIAQFDELSEATRFQVRSAFKESMMAPKQQPIIQSNKNKDAKKDQENQETNADMDEDELERIKLQQQQTAKDREFQPLYFVEFIEFLLRLIKIIFGEPGPNTVLKGYAAQVEHAFKIFAKTYDEKFRQGNDKSSAELTMNDADIEQWNKDSLEEEITLRLIGNDLLD